METFKLTGTGGEPHAQDNAISFQAGKDDYIILPLIPLEGEVCLSTTYADAPL